MPFSSLANESSDRVELLRLARLAEDRGDIPQAEQVWRVYLAGCCQPIEQVGWMDFLLRRGRLGLALRELTALLHQAEAAGDLPLVAASCSRLAVAFRCVGDLRTAQRFQGRALQHVQDCDATDLLHLAQQALVQKNWPLANLLARSVQDLASDDAELVAHAWATRGLSLAGEGDTGRGLRALRRAARLHREQNDLVGYCQDLINAAAICAQRSHHASRLKFLQKAAGMLPQLPEANWLKELIDEQLVDCRKGTNAAAGGAYRWN